MQNYRVDYYLFPLTLCSHCLRIPLNGSFFQGWKPIENYYRHIGLRIDLSHEGTVEKLIVEEGTRSLGTIIGQVDVHFEMRKVE